MPAISSLFATCPEPPASAGARRLAMITSRPAEAIGLGREIGSLLPGRRGDVVIWSGDPLEGAQRCGDGLYRRRAATAGQPPDQACAIATATCHGAICRRRTGIDPQARLSRHSQRRLCRIAFPAVAPAARSARRRGLASGASKGSIRVVALVTFGVMIWFYRAHRPIEPPLWSIGDGGVDRGRAADVVGQRSSLPAASSATRRCPEHAGSKAVRAACSPSPGTR